MPFTTPKSWSVNEVVTAANMNTHLRDNMSFVASPPQCSVRNSGPQSITNSTTTQLTADTENFDNDTMHSTVTNTSRITMTTAGRYMVSATVRFASNSVGQRFMAFFFNGTTNQDMVAVDAANAADTVLSGAKPFVFTAGQFIETRAFQSSGGNLNVTLEDFTAVLIAV